MAVADRVMVMRLGKYIQEMPKSETSIEEMSFLMVGRHIVERKVLPQETTGTVLDVKDLAGQEKYSGPFQYSCGRRRDRWHCRCVRQRSV